MKLLKMEKLLDNTENPLNVAEKTAHKNKNNSLGKTAKFAQLKYKIRSIMLKISSINMKKPLEETKRLTR
jgi:hypothetical protein